VLITYSSRNSQSKRIGKRLETNVSVNKCVLDVQKRKDLLCIRFISRLTNLCCELISISPSRSAGCREPGLESGVAVLLGSVMNSPKPTES